MCNNCIIVKFVFSGINMKIRFVIVLVKFLLFEAIISIGTQHEKQIKTCYKCPPGWGVIKKCTKYENTRCKKCNYGTYSSNFSTESPCFLCSRCGIGLYEAQKCTQTKDTVCDECVSIIGRTDFNQKNDFKRKCSYLFL